MCNTKYEVKKTTTARDGDNAIAAVIAVLMVCAGFAYAFTMKAYFHASLDFGDWFTWFLYFPTLMMVAGGFAIACKIK